jgi:hypothetical protein
LATPVFLEATMKTTGLKTLGVIAALAGSVALGASAAQARVSVGIGFGMPGYVVAPPPPVYYAPPPAPYYGAPAYYAPAPGYYGPGYWWVDPYGHRHWRRR